jgi:parallel beta-helix repeat protein
MNQCDDNGETGIEIQGKAAVKLESDLCRRNEWTGLLVLEEAVVTISGAVCVENRKCGVYLSGKGETECRETIADLNGEDGFCACEDRTVSFQKCKARMNRGSGFLLHRQAPQVMVECHSEDNQKWGIYACTPARLERNQVRWNKDTGILLADTFEYTIAENESTENGAQGIEFNASGEVRANRCEGNRFSGITIAGKSQARVNGNHCIGNGTCGILARGNASPAIEHNECRGNRMTGISCDNDAAGSIRENTVEANFGAAMYFSGRSKPLVENNRVVENSRGILQDPTAAPRLVNNTAFGNDLPNPDDWILKGSHEGRHFEYKQFGASMAVQIEPEDLLQRAALILNRLGWNPATEVMRDDTSGGYVADFRFSANDVNVDLVALSLVFQERPELNLTFFDSTMPMWLQQQAERLVARTLFGVSAELRDLTNKLNPWAPLHGDWSGDMFFLDGAGRRFEVRTVRR